MIGWHINSWPPEDANVNLLHADWWRAQRQRILLALFDPLADIKHANSTVIPVSLLQVFRDHDGSW